MSDSPENKGIIRTWLSKCHPILVFLIAVALIVLLDVQVRKVVAKPGLILRNEGHAPMAVPYMLDQIRNSDGVKIAWAGSSVLQGVNCTTAKTTAPVVMEKMFKEQDLPIRNFNLSHAGNIIADNFCLTHAAIDHGADMVVFEIVFGLFGGRGLGFQNARHEYVYYMRDLPDFVKIRTELLRVPSQDWLRSAPRLFIKNNWALFNHRSVLLYHYLGRHEDVGMQLGDRVMHRQGIPVIRHAHDVYGENDLYQKKNQDYYWKQQPKAVIQNVIRHFKDKMTKLIVTPNESRMRMMARSCAEGKKAGIPVLFYLAPINREMLDDYYAMDWDVYERFRLVTRRSIESQGCELIDLSDTVDTKYFVDSQHLNMNGHEKLAEALIEPITERLAKKLK